MKIIDIYDNTGAATTLDLLLASRLRALAWQGESVGAIRRRGRVADELAATRGIEVATTSFGFGYRLTLASKLRRLAGEADSRIIVHAHGLRHGEQAILAAGACGGKDMKVVVETGSGSWAGVSDAVGRFVAERADMMIFHCSADRDSFLARYAPSGAAPRCVTLNPGVSLPTAVSEPDASRELVVVWGGSITPRCGLDRVIEAMGATHHTPVKLIVAGQGRPTAAAPLIKRARALGLEARVEWLGDAALTPEVLSRADAAVFPSAEATDIFAVGAACMASGLPLILEASERMEQLAQPRVNALFFDPADPESLPGALRTLATDADLRAALSRAARAKAEAQSDLRFHTDNILAAYRSLLM